MAGFGPRVGRQAKARRKHGSTHLNVRSQANTRQAMVGLNKIRQGCAWRAFYSVLKDCVDRIYLVFIIWRLLVPYSLIELWFIRGHTAKVKPPPDDARCNCKEPRVLTLHHWQLHPQDCSLFRSQRSNSEMFGVCQLDFVSGNRMKH